MSLKSVPQNLLHSKKKSYLWLFDLLKSSFIQLTCFASTKQKLKFNGINSE